MNICFYKNYKFILGVLLCLTDLCAAEVSENAAHIPLLRPTKISAVFDVWGKSFQPAIQILLPDNTVRKRQVQANRIISIEDNFRPFQLTDVFQYTIISKYGDENHDVFMQKGTVQPLDENGQQVSIDSSWVAIQLSFTAILGKSPRRCEGPWFECRIKGHA